MHDCENLTMQEALPAYQAGTLEVGAAEAVRAHLATCEACQVEWEVLATARAVIERATPPIDLARLTAAVTAATAGAVHPTTAAPRVVALRTRRRWASRQLLAAAASILVVVSLSIPALRRTSEGAVPEVDLDSVGSPVAAGVTRSSGEASGAVDLAGGLRDLSSAQLEVLLTELDAMEGTIRAEPAPVALPLIDSPELL